MEALIDYFQTMPSSHRTVILFGGLAFFLLLENVAPFFQFKNSKFKHVGLNLFFTFTTIIINFVFAFILIHISNYVDINQIGLLWLLPLPIIIFTLLGVMLLDFFGAWLVGALDGASCQMDVAVSPHPPYGYESGCIQCQSTSSGRKCDQICIHLDGGDDSRCACMDGPPISGTLGDFVSIQSLQYQDAKVVGHCHFLACGDAGYASCTSPLSSALFG